MTHRTRFSLLLSARIARCLLWTSAALIALPSFAADPAAVLRAVRQATGGAAWDGVAVLHSHARLQANGQEGRAERWEDLHGGRFTIETHLPARDRADGFDGVSVWTQPPNGPAYVLGDADARLGAVDDSYRAARGWWYPDRHAATLQDAGSAREGARRFDRVRITPDGGRAFELWVDRATHLIDRVVEQQAEQLSVVRYADYRWVGGVRLPFTIRSGDGDAHFDAVESVEQIDVNPAIAETRYAIPPRAQDTIATPDGGAVTLPFRLDNNRILLDVTLNGRGPFDAEFDSGGSLIIPPAVVGELGLAAEGTVKQTGGGEGYTTSGHGTVDVLALGGAALQRTAFHSFAWDDGAPRRLLVGLEVLQRFVVHFDFDRLTVTLTPPARAGNADADAPGAVVLPFHFQDNQPEVTGSVDGIAGTFAVDTGDDGSLLLIAPFARRYGLAERYHATLPYGGKAIGGTHGVWARVGEIALNGADGRPLVRVTRPVTRISQQQSGFDANRYVSGNLGLGILKQFNLTFDYPHQRIVLVPNHLYGLPDVFDRSGLKLKGADAGWEVAVVYPGAAAERAGLRVGDRVLTIDGHPRDGLDRATLRALSTAAVGTPVALHIRRDGVERDVTIRLDDML